MTGHQISHYRILEKLGEGGMGVVYRAEDTRLGRTVALKILSPENPPSDALVDLLHHEARMGSALNHPNIATVFDLSLEGGRPMVVFEYLPGGTLLGLLEKRSAEGNPFTLRELIRFGSEIASGLAHAHRRGVVHGDIKTENVMLGEEGEAKITDFGVSALMSDDSSLRSSGGTIAYMSPEQVRGEPIGHHSDLFSFGVLLYELAAGRLPFRGAYGPALEYAILNQDPSPLDSIRSDLPRSFTSVVERLLQKNPEHRFQSAEEVASELEAAVENRAGSDARRSERDTVDAVTIAVLPLANKSGESDNEYLSDGITEEIIHALTKIEGLRVVAPASTFAFKGSSDDIRSIGARLHVGTVLEGSVRRGGNRLRIIVHLVEVSSGFDLWSESYDRLIDDIFAVQEEIARTIVGTLRVRLGAADRQMLRPHTQNLDAYTLYLKGRFELNRRTVESLRSALECFEQAVAIDPDYALGYTGIADTCDLMSWYGGLSPAEAFPRAKEAAEHALRIDDSLAEAHASMGLILHEYDWDWNGSEREFRRAIELNPGYALALHWYGLLLTRMGRFEEGHAALDRALRLDPVSLTLNLGLGVHLYSARRFPEAIEQLRKTLEMDRNYFPAIYFLGMAHEQQGEYTEAIAMLRRANDMQDNLETLGLLSHACAVAGERRQAEQLLAELMRKAEKRYVSPYNLALIHSALGQVDEAFAWLGKGCAERSMRMLFLRVDPAFDPIRSDPRFDRLLEAIGMRREG